MQLTTLVSTFTALSVLPAHVFGAEDGHSHPTDKPVPSTSSPPHTGPCPTITISDTAGCPQPTLGCIVLACLKIESITQSCGCPSVATVTTCESVCPTGCGATSYITAVEDCFPTHTPHPTLYPNSTFTKTKTETHVTTLTTCPAGVDCTGQTVTYTSTEVCPMSTCTCVLPSVTYVTTELPLPTETPTPRPSNVTSQTSEGGNIGPVPTSSSPIATPTFTESNVGKKWEGSIGLAALCALVFAVMDVL